MQAFHGSLAKAYDTADTAESLDTRIQNLNVRSDGVFDEAGVPGDLAPRPPETATIPSRERRAPTSWRPATATTR